MPDNEMIKFAKQKLRTVAEIAEKFDIPKKKLCTLRNRLKEANVKLKESRGRKRINLC